MEYSFILSLDITISSVIAVFHAESHVLSIIGP